MCVQRARHVIQPPLTLLDRDCHRSYPVVVGCALQEPTELDYGHYQLFDCSRDLPLTVFEAMPPKERGIVILNIQIQSEKQISIVISGATYSFRQQCSA